MASLKEIKVRIASIRSTQKITAAMKMVSSAKLHHTQTQTAHTLLYSSAASDVYKRQRNAIWNHLTLKSVR